MSSETGRSIVAMTGTKGKLESLRSIVQPDDVFVSGILGLISYELAGTAKEPVTHNGDFLIVGKALAQEQVFLQDAKNNPELKKLNGQKLIFARNDINTTSLDIPFTKSALQKESKMKIDQYQKLIVASLKYLAMKSKGIRLKFSWEEMQKDWGLIDECLGTNWNERVFLPIDYQSIDAYQEKRFTMSKSDNPKLEPLSPFVIVQNRAYAQVELDFRHGNALVEGVIGDYLRSNWSKQDFTPERYPLGIKHDEFLEMFVRHGQHVVFDDHNTGKTTYLRDMSASLVRSTLSRIEAMLNGFSKSSYDKAMVIINSQKTRDTNSIISIVCKPGKSDTYRSQSMPNKI